MGLIDLIVPEAVLLGMKANSSSDVIKRLGGILYERGYVRQDFVEATLAREAEMPTGLPLGGAINAAIPHVDFEYVLKPALAMATLAEPVSFQHMISPDEAIPVRLVFLIALDKPKSQVETLQQIASVLQDQALVEELVGAAEVREALDALQEVGAIQ